MKLSLLLAAGLVLYHAINLHQRSYLEMKAIPGSLEFIFLKYPPVHLFTVKSSLERSTPIDSVSFHAQKIAQRINPWDTAESFSDFLLAPTSTPDVPSTFATDLAGFIRSVENCGATVAIVPVPVRASVDSHPLLQSRAKTQYHKLLSISPFHTVDLLAEMRRFLLDRRTSELFLSTNGHWSKLGAAVSAKAVSSHLKRNAIHLAKPSGRLLQAGTSFSVQYEKEHLNFGLLLSRELQRELQPYYYDGARVLGSLHKLSQKARLKQGDLLVWEFPMLDFPQSPTDKIKRLSDIHFECELERFTERYNTSRQFARHR